MSTKLTSLSFALIEENGDGSHTRASQNLFIDFYS